MSSSGPNETSIACTPSVCSSMPRSVVQPRRSPPVSRTRPGRRMTGGLRAAGALTNTLLSPSSTTWAHGINRGPCMPLCTTRPARLCPSYPTATDRTLAIFLVSQITGSPVRRFARIIAAIPLHRFTPPIVIRADRGHARRRFEGKICKRRCAEAFGRQRSLSSTARKSAGGSEVNVISSPVEGCRTRSVCACSISLSDRMAGCLAP